jgi:hypothetical protein
MKHRRSETYAIMSGVIFPEAVRGRPVEDDSQLIDRAQEGRRTGKYSSRNHAAKQLSQYAKGASPEAINRRLNRKFKAAGID